MPVLSGHSTRCEKHQKRVQASFESKLAIHERLIPFELNRNAHTRKAPSHRSSSRENEAKTYLEKKNICRKDGPREIYLPVKEYVNQESVFD